MKQARKNYFTLIELLVVIAIIAILASLLMPALKAARAKGKEALCLNNIKQTGVLFMAYTQDSEDYYPPPFSKIIPPTYSDSGIPIWYYNWNNRFIDLGYGAEKGMKELLACPEVAGYPRSNPLANARAYSMVMGSERDDNGNPVPVKWGICQYIDPVLNSPVAPYQTQRITEPSKTYMLVENMRMLSLGGYNNNLWQGGDWKLYNEILGAGIRGT